VLQPANNSENWNAKNREKISLVLLAIEAENLTNRAPDAPNFCFEISG
jgi:hypothetical protein